MSFDLYGRGYNYDRKIAQGGSASVFLVHDNEGQYYAAKISTPFPQEMLDDIHNYEPDYRGPWTTVDRIDEEIVTLNKLKTYLSGDRKHEIVCHPNLVCYDHDGVVPNSQLPGPMTNPYGEDVAIILEHFVDGPTVHQMMSRQTTDQQTTDQQNNIDHFKLVVDMLSALSTLEDAGIYYPDLSEYNVIYDTDSNNYVIVDFNDVHVNETLSKVDVSVKQAGILVRFIYYVIHGQRLNHVTYELSEPGLFDPHNVFDMWIKDVLVEQLSLQSTIAIFSQYFPDTNVNIRLRDTIEVYEDSVKLKTLQVQEKTKSKPISKYPIDVIGDTVYMNFNLGHDQLGFISYNGKKLTYNSSYHTNYNKVLNIVQTSLPPLGELPHPTETIKKFADKGVTLSKDTSPENLFVLEQALSKYFNENNEDGNNKIRRYVSDILTRYNIIKKPKSDVAFDELLSLAGIKPYSWPIYKKVEGAI